MASAATWDKQMQTQRHKNVHGVALTAAGMLVFRSCRRLLFSTASFNAAQLAVFGA
jgi:hypothetical protein